METFSIKKHETNHKTKRKWFRKRLERIDNPSGTNNSVKIVGFKLKPRSLGSPDGWWRPTSNNPLGNGTLEIEVKSARNRKAKVSFVVFYMEDFLTFPLPVAVDSLLHLRR